MGSGAGNGDGKGNYAAARFPLFANPLSAADVETSQMAY
jgi:hypothetical protein